MSNRAQVANQCEALKQLASNLSGLADNYLRMLARIDETGLIDSIGRRTASFMEQVGDMLNATDYVSEEDEWMSPVFQKARELFPRNSEVDE